MFGEGDALDWEFGPKEALRRWPRTGKVVLLHSGRFHTRWARWSILAEPIGSYRMGGDGLSQWVGHPEDAPPVRWRHRPFSDLRALLDRTEALWIGYLSYDLARWIEKLPQQACDDRAWPMIELGCCPGYLVYDGQTRQWRAHGRWQHGGFPRLDQEEPKTASYRTGEPQSLIDRADYEATVGSVLDYIGAGDVFQVNLSHRFSAPFKGDYPQAPRGLFDRLATVSPAWYGAYLEMPNDNVTGRHGRIIASTSPELFLETNDAGEVVTRPIKGTCPAHVDPAWLRKSNKDRAELNMIVDLLRNDLGRVCNYDSIQVVDPRTIESHPTVHHGVATITGRLHPARDIPGLLRATMPGGSVTGVPKVRAMEIIDELEPVRRGPYCGCIGYLSPHGACLNIAIRTILIDPNTNLLDYSVGGGIVADSDPAAEYEETLTKAAAMLAALRPGESPLPNCGIEIRNSPPREKPFVPQK